MKAFKLMALLAVLSFQTQVFAQDKETDKLVNMLHGLEDSCAEEIEHFTKLRDKAIKDDQQEAAGTLIFKLGQVETHCDAKIKALEARIQSAKTSKGVPEKSVKKSAEKK